MRSRRLRSTRSGCGERRRDRRQRTFHAAGVDQRHHFPSSANAGGARLSHADGVTARCRLGIHSHLLGQLAPGPVDLLSTSEHAMRKLREEVGQTVVLSLIRPRSVVVVTTLLGKMQIEIGVKPGSEPRFHSSAQVKIALAFSRRRLAARLKSERLERFTEYTIRDPVDLEREVALRRQRGWATAPEDALLGINGSCGTDLRSNWGLRGCLGASRVYSVPCRTPDVAQITALLSAADRLSWNLGFVRLIGQTAV
jgi:IclR family transcriptional regulator, KDG regulon repressor